MRLLIITQVIDTEHSVLGFFHRWVEEFSKHCDHIEVIALQVGHYNLPSNVRVHSLGKESEKGKLVQLWRFYKLIWSLRHRYDSVFVHMNQIYVILGSLLWYAWCKKISLWYMHGTTTFSLRIAEKLTHYIFTGSSESCRINSKKIFVTGHGIDTEHFKINPEARKTYDLITVGRISAVKNIDTLLEALAELNKNKDVRLAIVGGPLTDLDEAYAKQLKIKVDNLNLKEKVDFVGQVNQQNLPATLNQAKVFVTAARNGSLDKAVLEALAVGLPVVSFASGTTSLPLGSWQASDLDDFIANLKKVLESNEPQSGYLAEYVFANHSLQSLVPKILKTLGRKTGNSF